MKFNKLNVPEHWQHYWSRYPEGYTILESLISWVSQVDSMVDDQNKLHDNVEQFQNEIADNVEQFRNEIDDFVSKFDKNLQNEVTQIITDWQSSGFLDVVISEALQWQLNDYIETNEQDKISLGTQLKQSEQRLSRAFKYGKLELPTDFPKEVPFNVYKTKEGYKHDFDFTPYEYTKKIYISSSGSTSADGLTSDTPTRNIENVLTILSNVVEDSVSIVFLDKFFPMLFWQQSSVDFGKNIRLTSAHSEGTVFGNFSNGVFTSVEDGLFKMTRSAVGKVLLYNVKDVWGNPSEALNATTLTECQQTPNSFYTDGTVVWVNAPTETLETANKNIGVLYRINFPLRFNINSNSMFIDNVKFAREANKSRNFEGLRISGTNQAAAIARNSYFNYGDRNGFETVNVGKVHLFDCQASYNLIDGFNYHGTGDELITEFNCYASDNGDDTQGSANATTAHDGMTILRLGSIGERCFGPVLADVNGCYSYNVGCAMYDSMNPDSYAFFFSETGSETPGSYYIIDCDADNPTGIDVVQNGGSPIKTRNSRFNTTTSDTEFEYI